MITPADWVPPEQWTRAPSKSSGGSASGFLILGVAIVLVTAGIGASVASETGFSEFPGLASLFAQNWDGEQPLVCAPNGRIELTEIDQTAGAGLVVDATAVNCTVIIRNSHISADNLVRGGINTTVEVYNSELTARDTGFVSGHNFELRIAEGSVVTSTHLSVEAEMNAGVRVTGNSRIQSEGDAIRVGINANIVVRGSQVQASGVAIRTASNTELVLEDCIVAGDEGLWEIGPNGDVDINQCELRGSRDEGPLTEIRNRGAAAGSLEEAKVD